jgi:hypothetical protein
MASLSDHRLRLALALPLKIIKNINKITLNQKTRNAPKTIRNALTPITASTVVSEKKAG